MHKTHPHSHGHFLCLQVAFTSADHCSGSLFWFTFGANPNCFKSGKLDSCSGVSVVVDVNGDTFQDGSEPGVYLAKDGKVVDYADYTFSRGTTEFVMDATIDDNSNNLYANFEFNGEGIFSGKKADGYDISFADGDLRSKHNKHISEKFAFGSLGGTCGQVHRIKSTTLEVTGHVWSKKNQKALKKLVVESGGWHGFSSLAAQIQEELLDGQPGTWAALMLGVAGAAAAFVVVNMATARRRRLGAEGQPYQAVSKNYQAAGAV